MSDERPQPIAENLRPSVPADAVSAAGLDALAPRASEQRVSAPGPDISVLAAHPPAILEAAPLESPFGEPTSLQTPPPESGSGEPLSEPGPRERSISPPGPKSDRYLGCTIDNRYKVEGIIGEGGMGVVYQCRHKIIDKRVALKILRADLARDAEVTERFLMEAKAASAIQDEHIISISDFGQLPDGAAYFVMEFLEGTPLAQLAGGGRPMAIERILPIACQLAEGLGSAHQRGIVHRDLKPDNVFLIQRGKEADFVKILDFGIAKVQSTGQGRLTQAGSVFGTPHYMSPEQAAGTPLDQRGDIYSMGVMLYELATGRVPFDAENFVGILSQHLYQEPITPRKVAPDAQIPEEFEAIILKCMAKRPEHRYQAMVHLRDDLWQLDRRLHAARLGETGSMSALDPAASVEGTALSTELTLASMRPRRWPMVAAIAAPLLIVSGVLAFELGGLGGRSVRATRSTEDESSASAAPAGAAAAPAADTTELTAPGVAPHPRTGPTVAPVSVTEAPTVQDSAAATTHVLLGVSPSTAHVFLDGLDMGASPVSVDVAPGSPVIVELRHPDYAPKLLELDGSRNRVVVELDNKLKRGKARTKSRATGAQGSGKPPSRTTPARGRKKDESIGGQLFVEPWQKP
ncbi:MAG: hypothetical protein RL685_5626 [Pseudomonadota bacterium]|jgi:serine/threonine-protein kinase